jgi:hypothetical protein
VNWTPYQIEIVLHHYYSSEPFPRCDAPLYPSTRDDLVSVGVLEWRHGIPWVTEKGKALVAMWCATPLPQQCFVDPRTNEVVSRA